MLTILIFFLPVANRIIYRDSEGFISIFLWFFFFMYSPSHGISFFNTQSYVVVLSMILSFSILIVGALFLITSFFRKYKKEVRFDLEKVWLIFSLLLIFFVVLWAVLMVNGFSLEPIPRFSNLWYFYTPSISLYGLLIIPSTMLIKLLWNMQLIKRPEWISIIGGIIVSISILTPTAVLFTYDGSVIQALWVIGFRTSDYTGLEWYSEPYNIISLGFFIVLLISSVSIISIGSILLKRNPKGLLVDKIRILISILIIITMLSYIGIFFPGVFDFNISAPLKYIIAMGIYGPLIGVTLEIFSLIYMRKL